MPDSDPKKRLRIPQQQSNGRLYADKKNGNPISSAEEFSLLESSGSGTPPPVKYRSEKKINWSSLVIPTSALLTGGLVSFAAPQLIDTSGILGALKMSLLGSGACFISWVVNHNAVEHGTKLAANGLKSAAVGSIVAISITGSAAFAFSYSGLVLPRVDALNQADHGRELSTYVDDVNQNSAQLYQLQAVVSTTAADLQTKIDCEVTDGCLSGNGGGKGAIYREILPPTQRAEKIAIQMIASDDERRNQLSEINSSLDGYNVILGTADLADHEKTRLLISKSSQIKQRVADLRESSPLLLLRGYQAELSSGLSIEGEPEGTTKVNNILKRHAETLRTALDDIELDQSVAPEFPGKAGVGQAFSRFSHFWPIGIFTAAIELIIPITIWLLTYLAIVLNIFRQEQAYSNSKNNRVE